MIVYRTVLAAVAAAVSTPALAHGEAHAFSGLAAGFLHPLGGFDHMLAMLAVGLFASVLGGRALMAVPASFLLMMLAGGVLGLTGVALPSAEVGIAASVVALGAIVASGRSWAVSTGTVLVGFFALFHGYAHGAEMPADAGAIPYGVGFLLASTTLHLVGIGIGNLTAHNRKVVRSTGMAIALAGLEMVLG
jgi:urease accessory protein